jgi:hypothetical protein
VHKRTIAYRLNTIEERPGYPAARRRDELAVALRIHALLPADGDGGGSRAGTRRAPLEERP